MKEPREPMNERMCLFWIWFAGFTLCILQVVVLYFKGALGLDDLEPVITPLTGIFAPYLTAILAFWFTAPGGGTPRRGAAAESGAGAGAAPPAEGRNAFRVAAWCSLFYNAILVLLFSSVFFRDGEDLVKDTVTLMVKLATLFTFLVGPIMGYFFGRAK